MNEKTELRLRQSIGESFIEWADVYFANAENLNKRIPRKAMHLSFKLYAPEQAKYSTSQKFKRQLIDYCVLRGYKLNEFVQDSMGRKYDKEDGIEYFTISITSTHNTDIQKRFIAQIKEVNNMCDKVAKDFECIYSLEAGKKYKVTTMNGKSFEGFYMKMDAGKHTARDIYFYAHFFKIKNDGSPSKHVTGELIHVITNIESL